MPVLIRDTAFDPHDEERAFAASLPVGTFGATASFVGTMRDVNEGDGVVAMSLEHYPGMTERELEAIVARGSRALGADRRPRRAPRRRDPAGASPIVLTAVWSAHRAAGVRRVPLPDGGAEEPGAVLEEGDAGGRRVALVWRGTRRADAPAAPVRRAGRARIAARGPPPAPSGRATDETPVARTCGRCLARRGRAISGACVSRRAHRGDRLALVVVMLLRDTCPPSIRVVRQPRSPMPPATPRDGARYAGDVRYPFVTPSPAGTSRT